MAEHEEVTEEEVTRKNSRAHHLKDGGYADAPFVDSPRTLWYSEELNETYGSTGKSSQIVQLDKTAEPGSKGDMFNLVSSLCDDGMHRPILDLDFHAVNFHELMTHMITFVGHAEFSLPVIARSTKFFHVYFPNLEMDWAEYVKLLDYLRVNEYLEEGYVNHSKNHGMTLLRPFAVRKDSDKQHIFYQLGDAPL